MNEIEVKVIDVNVNEIKNKILSLNGKLVKKELQKNYCYDLPPNVKNQNGFLRIRHINNQLDNSEKTVLCTKKIISQDGCRITDEREVDVLDLDSCLTLVESLELKLYRVSEKFRESYKLNDSLIEIDTLEKHEFPTPYIEIEAESKEKIFDTLKLLDIPFEKATSKSLRQLKLELGL